MVKSRVVDLYTLRLVRKVVAGTTLLFTTFCAIPFAFKHSVFLQRLAMFPNFDKPLFPQFNNFKKYGFRGVRSFFIEVKDLDNKSKISLGVWHVLPMELIGISENDSEEFHGALNSNKYSVVIYLHGNSGSRIFPSPLYHVLRQFFHVLAVDYRSYGDSTKAVLTEEAVVNDLVQLYKWVRVNTPGDIYIWGHSLGTSIATRTVAALKKEGIIPTGLVLEAPFTTMREELPYHPLGKIFSWLPYFQWAVLDPLEKNGFTFSTSRYILDVDCPIMILHAKDDFIIPYKLSTKLASIAMNERDPANQGDVTIHLFDAKYRYNHLRIRDAPELPSYIEEFIENCTQTKQRLQ